MKTTDSMPFISHIHDRRVENFNRIVFVIVAFVKTKKNWRRRKCVVGWRREFASHGV